MIVRIYLDRIPLERAKNREITFFNRVRSALQTRGARVEYKMNSIWERRRSATRNGYSLFFMDDPFHSRALTMRRAYSTPFWRIEASSKRWEFKVAREAFIPEGISINQARSFCCARRKNLFDIHAEDFATDGYVYIPLQGRLLEARSFQSTSPIEMIKAVLEFEPWRTIILGYHPGEVYLPEEINAVKKLVARHSHISVSELPASILARSCDYIVTQNSSVTIVGYLFHKPAVLFAKVDFHHIALCVEEYGIENAIKAAPYWAPEFDRYLFWFFRMMAIDAHSNDAEARILEIVRARGWQIN